MTRRAGVWHDLGLHPDTALGLCIFAAATADDRAARKTLAPKVFKNSRGETLPYRLFIPLHYDQKKQYPLVVYLHGGGGRGNDNRKQIDGGNGYLIDCFTSDELIGG